MALSSFDRGSDVYATRDFTLSAYPQYVNISVAGIGEDVKDHIFYDKGVWLSFHENELDELITALSYYRKYRTFKPKEA